MPIREKLTLGLGLLLATCPALADNYKIQRGDTVERVAKRLHVPLSKLLAANGLHSNSVLQVGRTVVIPGTSAKASSAKYVVRNGDLDWAIAKKHGLSIQKLMALNPSIDWDHLHTGQKLNVGSSVAANTVATALEAQLGGTFVKKSAAKITSRYALVTGDAVSIRTGPGTDREAVASVDRGSRVVLLDHIGEWYKARTNQGSGWIRGDFLKAAASQVTAVKSVINHPVIQRSAGQATQEIVAAQQKSNTVEKVLSRARSMRGTRYVWGAASRSATDCSGLTSQAYRSAGISIPRTSTEQATVGISVSRDQLRPGDLVFFRTVRGQRISHVGIYTGNGNFIHASSGKGHVMESSLGEAYYNNRYVTARRLVKSKVSPKDYVRSLPDLPRLEDITDPSALPKREPTIQAPPAKN